MSQETAAPEVAQTPAPVAAPEAAPAPVVEAPQAEAPAVEGPDLSKMAPHELRRHMKMQSREGAKARSSAAQNMKETHPAMTDPVTGVSPEAEVGSEPVVDAQGRAHDPATGKFLPSAEQADTEAGAPAAAAPQGSEQVAETTAAEGTPPEPIRIELPADHPLRGQGVEFLHVTDPQQERAVRALVNGYTRRSEVEQVQQRVRQMEDEKATLQARYEVAQERLRQFIADPQKAAFYADVKAQYGEDYAQRWLDGELQADEAQVQERLKPYQQEREQLAQQQAAEAFLSNAQTQAAQVFPQWWTGGPSYQQALETAVHTYDAYVERRWQTDQSYKPTEAEFIEKFLKPQFFADPFAAEYAQRLHAQQQQEAQRQAEAEKAKAEAEAARQKELAAQQAVTQFRQEAAQRREVAPPNPLGNVGGARGDKVSSEASTTDYNNMSAFELTRQLRSEARSLGKTRR